MSIILEIDRNKCIRCGRCVKACPSKIFSQETPAAEVAIHNRETCIVCGHCVAICPTDAVLHGNFPDDKVHRFSPEELPSPQSVMLLLKSRRSNRLFSNRPVPEELLELILEAANRAPTASNMQEVEFTLITDPERIKEVTDRTMDVFLKLYKRLNNPFLKPLVSRIVPEADKMKAMFEKLINSYKSGYDPVLRGATSLLLIHTAEKSRFGSQDSNLSYQNASIMAESLGVSQFYTGFVCTGLQMDNNRTLLKSLGIEGRVHAGMAMGIPSHRFEKYIDKKPLKVTRI